MQWALRSVRPSLTALELKWPLLNLLVHSFDAAVNEL